MCRLYGSSCACDAEWRFDSTSNLENQYQRIFFDLWQDVIPIGFSPVGMSGKISYKSEECRHKDIKIISSVKDVT